MRTMEVSQKCHQCLNSWKAVMYPAPGNGLLYRDDADGACPQCGHDSDRTHDCYQCWIETKKEEKKSAS